MSAKVKVCKTVGCGRENVDTAVLCSSCNQSLVGVVPIEPGNSSSQNGEPADANAPKQAVSDAPDGKDARACVNASDLSHGYRLEWPGETWAPLPVGDGLFIGRVPPAPEEIAREIEEKHKNVSRMHAELFFEFGELYVRDLNSINGTFVSKNGAYKRIDQLKREPLRPGDKIRFGAKLEATVTRFTN